MVERGNSERFVHEEAVRTHLARAAVDTSIAARLSYGDYGADFTDRVDFGAVSEPFYQASLAKAYVAGYVVGSERELAGSEQVSVIRMLERSDNQAYRRLVDAIGASEINDFMAGELGLEQTGLYIRDDGTDFAGFTTAAESLEVFRYLLCRSEQGGEFGDAVQESLAKPDSRYGVRAGIGKGARLLNKTGTDFSTVDDDEVGRVAVAHDVGFVQAVGDDGFSPFLYSITSGSRTVASAKRANGIMAKIGGEMAEMVGGQSTHPMARFVLRAIDTIRR